MNDFKIIVYLILGIIVLGIFAKMIENMTTGNLFYSTLMAILITFIGGGIGLIFLFLTGTINK